MTRRLDFLWPVVGLIAVVVSIWLLSRDFRGEAVASEVWQALWAISAWDYLLCIVSALVAYLALALYDRIALSHLGIDDIPFSFVALCSFTTYALSHTIGFSVLSGAMVRYRAYSTRGLTAAQIAVLVAITSITFALGTLLIGGIVLVFEPQELRRLAGMLPDFLTNETMAHLVGAALLALVVAYGTGSVLRLKPFELKGFRLEYPRPAIAIAQFIVAPLELMGAAAIIYFALPAAGNPGFPVVMAIFVGSFAAALVSNAPGGLGVFELLFINALQSPDLPRTKLLAAVLMFRLFYLLIPLAFAILVVILFERRRLSDALHPETADRGLEPSGPEALAAPRK
jgi:glycosyltransferase 2 family protein